MKKISIIILVIVGIAAFFAYKSYLSPTKIAFVNYPNFMYAKVATSNTNSFIKLDALQPDSLPNVSKYDMLVVFGMGIDLPAAEEQKIIEASQKGTKVYLQSSTNPRLQLTNIKGKQLDYITDYLNNGGKTNYRNMLNYIRREIDGKNTFTDTITPAVEVASDVLFHIDEEAVFEKVDEFEKYCQENNLHKEGNDKVILFTSIPGPFNANRDHMNSLINELQARNLNVYPIASFRGRLNYMKEIKPNLIVYMPHGRLSMGGSAQAIEAWLKEQNVPVLCPVSVMQKYDDWLVDKQGMVGGYLSQSVTMPEFDGGIVPYAVFVQYEDDDGLLLFKAIPNRLKKFGNIVENYLALQHQKNKDKKIAIVYFKGPGKNALEASNMEVLPSLHNTLKRLKVEGYNVDGLPDDYETFKNLVMTKGPVLGPYAEGAFDNFLKNGKPELIPAYKYEQWCSQTLPKELYTEVEKRYGKAPGSYMSVYKDTTDYIAIARVKFGNIVLLPQPLPGIGENEFQLIHGAKTAPPHTYIAPYLWIQNDFKADAIFHFGTHGSLEFTPGKQIALSEYDWTDPLIGTTPHFYVYTISNIGEGMIAKRRSYAVTQTHLTPPFIEAQAFAERKIMHQKIHKYEQAKGALKTEYALAVKELTVKEGIHKDIGLDSVLTVPYTEDEMMQLANYLEEIEHEKVTGGLYTMGVPYAPDKLKETVRLMMVDALAYNLAELDVLKGNITREQVKNKMLFNDRYTHPSEGCVDKVMNTGNADKMFNHIVTTQDIKRAEYWTNLKNSKNKSRHKRHGHGVKKEAVPDTIVTDAERKDLRNLIINIISIEEKKEFIAKLESDKEYERAISLLDEAKFARAERMSKFIPAMGKALKTVSDSSVHATLKLMKKRELRSLAIQYLKDKNLEKEVEEEKRRQEKVLLAKAMQKDKMAVVKVSQVQLKTMKLQQLQEHKAKADFYMQNKNKLIKLLYNHPSEEHALLQSFLEEKVEVLHAQLSSRINALENIEDSFAQAVHVIKSTLQSVIEKKNQLQSSPEKEFLTILNSLNGGYTPPTSGGDPVANPSSIATGRNLYAVNAEATPTKEAWKVAKKLGDALLKDYKQKHDNEYPEKISFTLWSSSFIESEGTTIGQILYILGVEPIWDPFGRVKDVKLIPLEELGRPRIDVVVQTSGQLRDIAASRLFLINRAIAKVASLNSEGGNFVAKGVRDAEKKLIEKGFSPKQARELSSRRIFGGVNGNYGTGIMGMVENSGRWDSTKVVAQNYINNMGATYTNEDNWGDFEKGVFEAALLNTQAVVQPRQSNTWGALSLDHVYEFMGGLNLAVKEVTGNDAESYFNDFRNASNPRVQGLKEAVWVETRTTLLNPRYIKEYMKGGASSAETFAETFRNTFGWNVMKPSVIENRLWDKLYDTYVQDNKQLGIHQFFERENPYALQEMTAVMLETVRKGMWKATPEQIKAMAQLHANLVKEHEAGCSGFVCDNQKLRNFISENLNPQQKVDYMQEINTVRESTKERAEESVILKKEEKITPQQKAQNFTSSPLAVMVGSVATLLLIILFVVRRKKK